ncbi:unnamed protein product [Ectocarpus sp. 12 AP-2014]
MLSGSCGGLWGWLSCGAYRNGWGEIFCSLALPSACLDPWIRGAGLTSNAAALRQWALFYFRLCCGHGKLDSLANHGVIKDDTVPRNPSCSTACLYSIPLK